MVIKSMSGRMSRERRSVPMNEVARLVEMVRVKYLLETTRRRKGHSS
jgi:hypothetical protein